MKKREGIGMNYLPGDLARYLADEALSAFCIPPGYEANLIYGYLRANRASSDLSQPSRYLPQGTGTLPPVSERGVLVYVDQKGWNHKRIAVVYRSMTKHPSIADILPALEAYARTLYPWYPNSRGHYVRNIYDMHSAFSTAMLCGNLPYFWSLYWELRRMTTDTAEMGSVLASALVSCSTQRMIASVEHTAWWLKTRITPSNGHADWLLVRGDARAFRLLCNYIQRYPFDYVLPACYMPDRDWLERIINWFPELRKRFLDVYNNAGYAWDPNTTEYKIRQRLEAHVPRETGERINPFVEGEHPHIQRF